jgi:hypothetical protein
MGLVVRPDSHWQVLHSETWPGKQVLVAEFSNPVLLLMLCIDLDGIFEDEGGETTLTYFWNICIVDLGASWQGPHPVGS